MDGIDSEFTWSAVVNSYCLSQFDCPDYKLHFAWPMIVSCANKIPLFSLLYIIQLVIVLYV